MPFKVICIQIPKYKWTGRGVAPLIEIGTSYVVVDEETYNGTTFYTLAEIGASSSYDARCFALLNDDPEEEMTDAQESEAAEYDRQFAEIIQNAENAI